MAAHIMGKSKREAGADVAPWFSHYPGSPLKIVRHGICLYRRLVSVGRQAVNLGTPLRNRLSPEWAVKFALHQAKHPSTHVLFPAGRLLPNDVPMNFGFVTSPPWTNRRSSLVRDGFANDGFQRKHPDARTIFTVNSLVKSVDCRMVG
jgi:hypothetical protein